MSYIMSIRDVGETVVSGNSIEWTIKNLFSVPLEDKCIASPIFYFENERFRFLLRSTRDSLCASRSWLVVHLECQNYCSQYAVRLSIRRKSGERTEGSTALYHHSLKSFSLPQFMQWGTLVQNKDELVPNGHLTIICNIHRKGDEPAEVKSRLDETSLASWNPLKRDAAVQTIAAVSNAAVSSIASESKDETRLVSLNQLKRDAAVQTIEDADVSSTTSESKDDAVALRGHFEAMYETGEFCDFDFKVQNRVFHTHKMVLAARSSAFASMLRHDMKEKKTGVVEIVDCDSDTFEAFLKFLYGGKNEVIIPENVVRLYEVANKYDVQNLKDECYRYMMENLSVELFCDVMCLALKHDEGELIKRATEYFKLNKKNIFLSVKWQIFLEENPTYANELLIKICD